MKSKELMPGSLNWFDELLILAMEGNVYICHWKKSKNLYKLWLKDHVEISVSDESFREAEEKMWELICLRFGDGEGVLEFNPAPPVNSLLEAYQSPEIVSVSGNDTVDAYRLTRGLFENDYCPSCTRAWGERTNVELDVESLPTKSDGAICMSIPGLGYIFSEAFLHLLHEHEKGQFRFLRVKSKRPNRREFFELVGRPIADFVGVSGFPDERPQGLLCNQCGYVSESHLFKNEIYNFITLEDLPTPVPSVFSIGRRGSKLCMTAKRWNEIRGCASARNIVASRIYVVPKGKALHPPK